MWSDTADGCGAVAARRARGGTAMSMARATARPPSHRPPQTSIEAKKQLAAGGRHGIEEAAAPCRPICRPTERPAGRERGEDAVRHSKFCNRDRNSNGASSLLPPPDATEYGRRERSSSAHRRNDGKSPRREPLSESEGQSGGRSDGAANQPANQPSGISWRRRRR